MSSTFNISNQILGFFLNEPHSFHVYFLSLPSRQSLTKFSLFSFMEHKFFMSLFLCLSSRHLARNPFICDCNLQWLAEYLVENPIETSGARCETPRRMRRKKITRVKPQKYKCKGEFWLLAWVKGFFEDFCLFFLVIVLLLRILMSSGHRVHRVAYSYMYRRCHNRCFECSLPYYHYCSLIRLIIILYVFENLILNKDIRNPINKTTQLFEFLVYRKQNCIRL
jgi:hypothetical protein